MKSVMVLFCMCCFIFSISNAYCQSILLPMDTTTASETCVMLGIDTSNTARLHQLVDTSALAYSTCASIILATRGYYDIVSNVKLSYPRAIQENYMYALNYLIALYLLRDQDVVPMTKNYIDSLITNKLTRSDYDVLNINQAVRILLNVGDYSKYNTFDSLFEDSTVSSSEYDVNALVTFAADPSLRARVKSRLESLLENSDANLRTKVIYNLRLFNDDPDIKSIYQSIAVNDTNFWCNTMAIDRLIDPYHDTTVLIACKTHTLQYRDTAMHFIAYQLDLERYNSPKALLTMEQIRDSVTSPTIKDYYDRKINSYIPLQLNSEITVNLLIDTLLFFEHEVRDIGWIGDGDFVISLDSNLILARNLLEQSDSLNSYRQVRQYRQRVDSAYNDPLHPAARTISIEGWKFLHYNANYILDRLPIPPPQYSLHINSTSGGSVTKTPDHPLYDSSAVVALTALPDSIHTFTNWSDSLTGSANPSNIVMNSNKVVTPHFQLVTYAITPTAGPHGTIAPDSAVFVTRGQAQAFTITPSAGYHVDSVFVDSVKVDSNSSYTFTNVIHTHTIRAVFAINQYQITASAGSHGTISPSGTTMVNYGTNQRFTFAPDSGYRVDSVIVDSVKVDSTLGYTFTSVQSTHTIRTTHIIDHKLLVPSKFSTIQAAVNFARHRDTILVSPGTYNESVNIESHDSLSLIASGGMDSVIVKTFGIGESNDILIKGFVIGISGSTTYGILITGVQDGEQVKRVTIESNVIKNSSHNGIDCTRGSAIRVVNNRIYENTRDGITIDKSNGIYLINNTIVKNGWNGVLSACTDSVYLINNIISYNGTASSGTRYGVCRSVCTSMDPEMIKKDPEIESLPPDPCPSCIRLLNNLITGNNGTTRSTEPKASKDLYNFTQILDSGNDSSNYTTAGTEGTGVIGSTTVTFSNVFQSSSPINLHLNSGSFPINKGVSGWSAPNSTAGAIPGLDFEGTTRPQGSYIDMGADEAQ
jgi:parallel beta-helix repeat protein